MDAGIPPERELFYASRINDRGEIAGVSGSNQAAVWTKAKVTEDLGTLCGSGSFAADINNLGQVVGWSSLPNDDGFHAFLWTRTAGMQDLGSLGGNTFASGINDLGEIVGYSCTDSLCSSAHAVLWTKARGMEDLGTLPGGNYIIPTAINDFGQVVGGACIDSPCFFTHAFLWTRQNGIEDLNNALPPNSGFELTYANDNNCGGQIIVRRSDETAAPPKGSSLFDAQ